MSFTLHYLLSPAVLNPARMYSALRLPVFFAARLGKAALPLLLPVVGLVHAGAQTVAQGDAQGENVAFKSLRWEEDYAYLQKDTAARRPVLLNAIKYIPLNAGRKSFLSVGGEVRYQYDFMQNNNWGAGPEDSNGYLLQRYMLHTDWHLGRHVRLFGQLKSGIETGKAGGPDLPDEDQLDLHQAFMDVRFLTFGQAEITLRAGRQEMSYGSSRLVSVREGPNVRQSFDAGKIIVKQRNLQIDAFVSRPVETRTGVFDDRSDPNVWFWGLYTTKTLPAILNSTIDLYYFGLKDQAARFQQGLAIENRHSLGIRLWSNQTQLGYNLESVYQLGSFGSGSIRAWTASAELTYGLAALPLEPKLNLRTEIISGDKGSEDPALNTFNPLFPKGAYFGQVALIGPANLVDIHPSASVTPAEGLELIFDWDFFWRERLGDGLYGVPYVLVRESSTSRSRYIGDQLSLEADWQANRYLQLEGFFTFFRAGPFLKETGPGKNLVYLSSRITFKF